MADENNAPNLVAERVIDNPSSSQQNIGNETLDDVQSVASSANSLQMSMLENKLELQVLRTHYKCQCLKISSNQK